MTTETVNFNYNSYIINCAGETNLRFETKGTTPVNSQLFDIKKVQQISYSVTGGFAWWAAIDSDNEYRGISGCANMTVTIYLVKDDGQTKVSVKTETGSATRGGSYNCYDTATTSNGSYVPTASDIQNYKYVQLVYSVSTSGLNSTLKAYSASSWKSNNRGNPTGTATITLKKGTNINYNSTEVSELKYNSTAVSSLKYNGTTIF